ncbi:MAG: hypothetical protein V4605_09525 [Pseudomonadota bacterium]
MAVQYFNGQLYDTYSFDSPYQTQGIPGELNSYSKIPGLGLARPINLTPQQPTMMNNANPFTSASSGGVAGTLQPYINRMTQNASNALYGGLLNYQPQAMQAGNAGGTPITSQVPEDFNIQSALKGAQSGGLLNFGNRSWMNNNGTT